jgi:hypothetical protein
MQGADNYLFAPLMIFEEVGLLAIDPITSKLLTHLAVKAVTDAEARKRMLIFILTPLIAVLLIITMFFYILTHPLEFLGQFINGEDLTAVEQLQNDFGMYQSILQTDPDYIDNYGKSYEGVTIYNEGETPAVYYNQLDSRWADKPYGTDTIGGYACGPTSMAMVVSSLTNTMIDPVQMSKWSYENGYWCKGSGSYHALIPGAAKAFGLNVEGCSATESRSIVDALSSGKLVVAIMTKGHFTSSGHFIVLRGITKEGKILVADPASNKRSKQEWDLSIILNEVSKSAGAGGPFWIISRNAGGGV